MIILTFDYRFLIFQALHALLEDGLSISIEDDDEDKAELEEEFENFSFIGLSNWALDPAKMNRGVMVLRGVPDKSELIITAE